MSEEVATQANDNTAGVDGGSEVKAAEASTTTEATAGADTKATSEAATTDSLLAGETDGDAGAEGSDAKPEAEKKEGEEDGKDKDAEEITPESYGEFDIPDGMPINQPLLDEFKQFAATNKMSKETAQAIVSLKVKEVQEQHAAFQEQRKAWVGELKADPDFGGKGFDSNVKTATLALRQFDTDGSALKVLQATGLDNHPAIVKMLHRVGVGVADDKVHTTHDRGGKPEKPLGEALFGDMFEKK